MPRWRPSPRGRAGGRPRRAGARGCRGRRGGRGRRRAARRARASLGPRVGSGKSARPTPSSGSEARRTASRAATSSARSASVRTRTGRRRRWRRSSVPGSPGWQATAWVAVWEVGAGIATSLWVAGVLSTKVGWRDTPVLYRSGRPPYPFRTGVDMASTRPLVRSATLNGYLGLARSLELDGPRLMRRVGLDPADLAVPDKWIPAADVARLLDISAKASRPGRLRGQAGRAASALDARPPQRGASRGARPAQRPAAPPALRAQLQRGPAHAAGGDRRGRHDPPVVRVRRAGPGGPGARPGCRRAARHRS